VREIGPDSLDTRATRHGLGDSGLEPEARRSSLKQGEIGLDASDFRKIAQDVPVIIEAFMRDFPETEFIEV
jgi:hypothetical protein